MTKFIISLVLVVASATASQGKAKAVTTRDIMLGLGDKAFSSVILTNTHGRTYTDTSRPSLPPPAPSVPNRCSLDETDQGVIWKIVLRGAAVSAKEISVSDESGRALVQVCWSSSGSVYQIDARGNRTGGGPQTEFLAAGPDAPRQLTFKFGATSAVVKLAK